MSGAWVGMDLYTREETAVLADEGINHYNHDIKSSPYTRLSEDQRETMETLSERYGDCAEKRVYIQLKN